MSFITKNKDIIIINACNDLTLDRKWRLCKLIKSNNGTLKDIRHYLKKIGITNNNTKQKVIRHFDTFKINKEIRYCKEKDIDIISYYDTEEYPKFLYNIYNPPLILYKKGTLHLNSYKVGIAIVGSRACTRYGKMVATKICGELARKGIVTVSGLARGIDTIGHIETTKNKGITIGVLGSGINVIYPSENKKLVKDILDTNGCILSEYALNTPPDRSNFPTRNRIIAGLTYGTVVIESGRRGGSMITVEFALEQGKEVYAVPGPINSRLSAGPNYLIRSGAVVTTCAEDIIETLPEYLFDNKTSDNPDMEIDEKDEMLNIITQRPIHIDAIAEKLNKNINTILSKLLVFELQGKITKLSGGYYIRK